MSADMHFLHVRAVDIRVILFFAPDAASTAPPDFSSWGGGRGTGPGDPLPGQGFGFRYPRYEAASRAMSQLRI